MDDSEGLGAGTATEIAAFQEKRTEPTLGALQRKAGTVYSPPDDDQIVPVRLG